MERPELSISVRRTDREAVVSLTGELDLSTAPALAGAINDVLADAPSRIELDMSGVTFCDSQGLGTLVLLSRQTTIQHSYLVLTNVGDALLRVLDITGLRPALMIRA